MLDGGVLYVDGDALIVMLAFTAGALLVGCISRVCNAEKPFVWQLEWY